MYFSTCCSLPELPANTGHGDQVVAMVLPAEEVSDQVSVSRLTIDNMLSFDLFMLGPVLAKPW